MKETGEPEYMDQIRYCCLIMSEQYIRSHFGDIKHYANVIEKRLEDFDLTAEWLIDENNMNLDMCNAHHLNYLLIDNEYTLKLNF